MSDEYCKLLIVDDEYVTRQGIKYLMEWETEGFKIIGEASNGEEALQMMEEVQPDIVLSDIVMPIMDGIEFVNHARQKYPNTRVIILSSYDKFDYVKEALLNGAVDYILKPALTPETLLEVLIKAVKTIPNLHLKKDKELSMNEKLERYLSEYDVSISDSSWKEYFPYARMRLLCTNLNLLCDGYKDQEQEILKRIYEYFEGERAYKAEVLLLKEGICCVVLNYPIKAEFTLIEDVTKFVDIIKSYKDKAFFVYGETFRELSDLKERYVSTCQYIGRRFYNQKNALYKEGTASTDVKTEKFDYETYAASLKYQDYMNALSLFENYVEKLCEAKTEEYVLKNTTKNLLYNFLVEWEKTDQSFSGKRTKFFHEIDNCTYIEEFKNAFQTIMSQLKNACDKDTSSEHKIVEICQYIREHYMENLELVQLAKQFNYNYNYLSTYFNKEVNEGFAGYLNGIRIEKACDLLKTTTRSIAEISDMVGYSDHSYFCRVFKNSKGKTPSQWRKKPITEKISEIF